MSDFKLSASPYLQGVPSFQETAWHRAVRRWKLQWTYYRKFHSWIDFREPDSFQQKIQFRKIYGNHPLYAALADKFRVREFVAERVGPQYLIPLLGVHDRLTEAAFEPLPEQFIIKANHGSKWHQIVTDKSQLDVPATVRRCNRWMERRFGERLGEFHYRLIPPKLIIEELLVDQDASPPDYNFFCFHNGEAFDYSLSVSMPDGERSVAFDKQWNITEITCTPEEAQRVSRPPHMEEMLEVARRLSRGFDFVRVDLYNVRGRIYFGELTWTPASGLKEFTTDEKRVTRNAMWKLDRENPVLYRQAG
jgi:hypothetical protein